MRPDLNFKSGVALLFTLLALTCGNSHAATIKWTNPAGGNFSTPANWSPAQVPGASDIAVINLNGTYTVTVDVPVSVVGILVGGTTGTQTLSVSAANLTMVGPSLIDKNGILNVSGSTVALTSGSNPFLENFGTINWTGGTFGSGLTENRGNFNIQAGTAKTFDNHSLNNYGTLTWSGSTPASDFDLKTMAGILNYGLFDMTGNAIINSSTMDGSITDIGLMRKSAGTGMTTINNVAFGIVLSSQVGTLEVDTGTLFFTMRINPLNAPPGTTLTNGKYNIKGVLKLKSAAINSVVNADIILDGASAQLQDDTGAAGLATLNSIDINSSLTLLNSATLNSSASFTNSGKVVVTNSTLTTSTYTQNPSSETMLNSGTIVASTFDNYTGGGTLSGSGILTGNVTNTGLISPGSLPSTTGTITVNGSFTNSTGTLNMKVSGTSAGQFDKISMSSGTISGTINATMVNGYHPVNNDQITAFSGATGGTASVNFCGAACIAASVVSNTDLKFTTDIQATWTGAINSVWGNSSNWSPPSVPNSSSTNVRIPNTVNIPVLDASYACKDLLVDAGAGTRLDLSTFNLDMHGNLQTSGAIATGASGRLNLDGSNVTFETLGANGSLGNARVVGTYYAANNSNDKFVSNLDVTGVLILNGGTVTVSGTYSHSGATGVMQMFYPADHLILLGNANFNGASESGFINAGLLEIQGNFTSGGSNKFFATAPHITRFTGAASTATPSSGDQFGALEIGTGALTANLEFDADAKVSGNATIVKGIVTTNPTTVTVKLDSNLIDPPGGNWRAGNTNFTGTTPQLPPTIASNVTFSSSGTVTPPLGFTITGANNLTVLNGFLDIGSNLIVVGNDFVTNSLGGLQMLNQAGELSVFHDVNLNADSGITSLFAGRIRVKHNFLTLNSGEGPVLGAQLVHVVTFDGSTPQSILLGNSTSADSFQNLEVNGASSNVTINSATQVNGVLKLLNGTLTVASGMVLTLGGDGCGLNAGTLILNSTSQLSTLSAPLTMTGGTLQGKGTIFGNVNNVGGTVAPGMSGAGNEGTLGMGNYTQGAGGTLTVRVSSISSFDVLNAGALTLAGTLNIVLDGYTAALNDSFNVVSGSPITGTFTTVNGKSINATLGFDTQYMVSDVALVVLQKPQITNAVLTATGQVGQAFASYTITTSGSPTIVVSTSTLPSGLTLSGNVIMGTPVAGAEGTTLVTLTATNNVGVDVKTLTLTINRTPSFTSAASASSLIGQPFTFTFAAAGFPAPTFATTSTLPAGLTLTGGTLSGTPTAAGATTIALTATNSVGNASQNFVLTITTSGPPVLVSVASTPNPQQTGQAATFTAVATQPDGAALTFTWDFKDGSAPVVGNPVQHIYTIENSYAVSVSISDGSNVVTGSVSQQALAPASGGTGVPNIGQNDPPIPDPFSGITLSVTSSEGGVLTFGIDINALLRDEFSVGTDFQSISGRSDTVAGTTVVHKFTDPGIYVATSTATETATQLKKGKARKTVAITALETGTPPKFTHKPLKNTITGIGIKGNFQFNRNGDGSTQTLALSATPLAATAKPDLVTMSGSIELPEGLDLSQPQDFSFGIGNIIDQVSVTSKGKAVLPSQLKRIKSLSIKYPKLASGSTLTTAGQSAKFTISISQTGLSAAGFDTEGITGTLKTGETAKSTLTRTIQVAMAFAGEVWEVQAPVQFKLATSGSSGTISGRSGN